MALRNSREREESRKSLQESSKENHRKVGHQEREKREHCLYQHHPCSPLHLGISLAISFFLRTPQACPSYSRLSSALYLLKSPFSENKDDFPLISRLQADSMYLHTNRRQQLIQLFVFASSSLVVSPRRDRNQTVIHTDNLRLSGVCGLCAIFDCRRIEEDRILREDKKSLEVAVCFCSGRRILSCLSILTVMSGFSSSLLSSLFSAV